MPGLPNGPLHEARAKAWREAQVPVNGNKNGKGWVKSDVGKYRAIMRKRDEKIEADLKAGVAPDFFTEYLPHVQIESDDPEQPGWRPFEMYPFQREVIESLLEGKSIVWAKERQIGASWTLAAYSYWLAAYHAAHHVGLVSMGQREANELMRKVLFIHNHLPAELAREHDGWRTMSFRASGSTLIAFPSTAKGGVSFRFSLLIQDEAARHPFGQQNYYEYMPTIAQGGQVVICSTSNPELGPSGFFYNIVQETLRGDNDYKLVFSGRYSRPEHTDEFYERMKKRYKMGQYEFDSHYPMTLADAFQGKTGLVFHQFNPQVHVTKKDPRTWLEYDYRICGIDPGGGDPTAIVMMGAYQDHVTGELHWHQPAGGEFYQRGGATLDDIRFFLSRWPKLTRVYPDTAGGDLLLKSLQQLGYQCYPAVKDRAYGMNLLAGLIESAAITIHESNENSISEFNSYRWLERTDPNDRTRYKTATPVDNHADAMDARRYAVASFTRLLERQVAGGYQTPRDRQLAGYKPQSRAVSLSWR